MITIEQLEPASKVEVEVYRPYYPSKEKQKLLPIALSLYQQGKVEGQRLIEGAQGIEFVATWYVSKLPSELTRCRVQFEGQADLSYEITILNSEFIDYLIDLLGIHAETKKADFPQNFYKKLLHFDENPSLSA
ncbi:MAG: type IV pilus biogenesis protein EbsA [Cyanobacteriota bacterium]|jgi:hypothetical protein